MGEGTRTKGVVLPIQPSTASDGVREDLDGAFFTLGPGRTTSFATEDFEALGRKLRSLQAIRRSGSKAGSASRKSS